MGFSQAYSVFSPPLPPPQPIPAPQPCRSAKHASGSASRSTECPLSSELHSPARRKKKTDSPRFAYSLYGAGSVLFKTRDLLFQKHLCFKNKVLSSLILNVALHNNLLKCSIFVLKVLFYYLFWISEGRFNPLYMKISSHCRKKVALFFTNSWL